MLAWKNCHFGVVVAFSLLTNFIYIKSFRECANVSFKRTFFAYARTFILRTKSSFSFFSSFLKLPKFYLIHPHIVHNHHRQESQICNTFHPYIGKTLYHSHKPLLGKQIHQTNLHIPAHNLTSILKLVWFCHFQPLFMYSNMHTFMVRHIPH